MRSPTAAALLTTGYDATFASFAAHCSVASETLGAPARTVACSGRTRSHQDGPTAEW